LALADEAHRGQPSRTWVAISTRRPWTTRPSVAEALREVARLAAWTPGRTLLDAGSGTVLRRARAAAGRPLAVDASPAATARGRRRTASRLSPPFFPMPARSVDRSSRSSCSTFPSTSRSRGRLARVRELLEPGGVVVIDSPNHASILCRVIDGVGRCRSPRSDAARAVLPSCPRGVFSPRALAACSRRSDSRSLPKGRRVRSSSADLGTLTSAVRVLERVGAAVGMQSRCWIAARVARDR
jgi:hypothetical protein